VYYARRTIIDPLLGRIKNKEYVETTSDQVARIGRSLYIPESVPASAKIRKLVPVSVEALRAAVKPAIESDNSPPKELVEPLEDGATSISASASAVAGNLNL
jgi:hypothetical protein